MEELTVSFKKLLSKVATFSYPFRESFVPSWFAVVAIQVYCSNRLIHLLDWLPEIRIKLELSCLGVLAYK